MQKAHGVHIPCSYLSSPSAVLVTARDAEPDGSFGPIDPSNEDNFFFLEQFFLEVASRFHDHYVHLGADEVDFGCW